jgi:hypothetical protein
LYDGGVVFFVVYISKNCNESKIYYVELPPIKIRRFLEVAKGRKTTTIKLIEFPNDGDKKATIFLNCLQNCKKQASFFDVKLRSMEELQKEGILESLTVPFVGVGVNDPNSILFNNEIYFYANIKGSSIPQPLEILPKNLTTTEVLNVNISIDDKIYYKQCSIITRKSEKTLIIGKSFSIKFFEDKHFYNVQYKNSCHLRTLAVDLDFMINCIEFGYFAVNGLKCPFDKESADFSDFNMEEQRERLNFCKRTIQALDTLGCNSDIDLTTLSNEDIRNLNLLALPLWIRNLYLG